MPLVDESTPWRMRRVATLKLSAETLIQLLMEMQLGRRYFTAKGLPENARVAGIGLDATSPNTFTVLLESEEFSDVPRGAVAPEIQVVITAHEHQKKASDQLVTAVREGIRQLDRAQR